MIFNEVSLYGVCKNRVVQDGFFFENRLPSLFIFKFHSIGINEFLKDWNNSKTFKGCLGLLILKAALSSKNQKCYPTFQIKIIFFMSNAPDENCVFSKFYACRTRSLREKKNYFEVTEIGKKSRINRKVYVRT
jgi:hypothetical protein